MNALLWPSYFEKLLRFCQSVSLTVLGLKDELASSTGFPGSLVQTHSRHLPYAPLNRKFFEVTDVVLATIKLPVTSIVAGT